MDVSWKLLGFQQAWNKNPGFWTQSCLPDSLLLLLEALKWFGILTSRNFTTRDHDFLVFLLNNMRASASVRTLCASRLVIAA